MNAFTLKAERNFYYYKVRRTKRQCWVACLQGTDVVMGESKHCWIPLRYTKPWSLSTTPALEDSEGNEATMLKNKDRMIRKAAFLHPPTDPIELPPCCRSSVYQRVDEAIVWRALFHQSQKKAPDSDWINISALRLL